MNGGLHQYFFNHPEPELLDLVLLVRDLTSRVADEFDRYGGSYTRPRIEG